MSTQPKVLITGASGYIGSRLIRYFEKQKTPIRCLAREPQNIIHKISNSTSVVRGDVLKPDTLKTACDGIETAYYLIHSMNGEDFENKDRRAAQNFVEACQKSGVKKIIYLGGLGDDKESLSKHLKSRHEVGQILRQSKIPVVELRASIILGSGSLSFEMIRNLVEKLPIMITPSWVRMKAQPIAIEDIIAYLVAAHQKTFLQSKIFEIGGKDKHSYGELMQEYAKQRGLKRVMVPFPFLTPWLSSLWLGFITPLYARIGKVLILSIKNPTVVRDHKALEFFNIKPMSLSQAMERALSQEDQDLGNTRWCDAISSSGIEKSWGGVKFGNRLVDNRTLTVNQAPDQIFKTIQSIGGNNGWYYGNFLWKIRGTIDLLLGGVGMKRKRPKTLKTGSVLDCWRVENITPNKLLRLKAEMKLPGRAWLEFRLTPQGKGQTLIEQTAIFDPFGLMGKLYWYSLYVVHEFIFKGMLHKIAKISCKTV